MEFLNALKERIAKRSAAMFEAGLISEVEHILSLGFPSNSKALMSIGYREAVLYLQRQLSLDEAVEQTSIATRQYAKRQMTWFRREPGIRWLYGFGTEEKLQQEAVHHLGVDIEFSLGPHKNLRNESQPGT